MTSRRDDLDRFYALLAELERRCGGKRRLVDATVGWDGRRAVCTSSSRTESSGDSGSPRVVRVGTHGLRPSSSTLWGRLSQHKGSTAGSMPGGGNHRGSIFRLHFGTALLSSGGWPEAIATTWSVGSTASAEVRTVEYPLERAVSVHIGAMPLLWLTVDDPPGPSSDRAVIEAGAIALLSNLDRPALDPPSAGWLGALSTRRLVRESGLRNVNHVQEPPDAAFLSTWTPHRTDMTPTRSLRRRRGVHRRGRTGRWLDGCRRTLRAPGPRGSPVPLWYHWGQAITV